MKTHYILLSFFFLGLLNSCSPIPNATELIFKRAEQCMETQPDSALKLLDSLYTSHHELEGENLARYYLLLTQARDKNYMQLSTDSSIVYSVDYYKKAGDKVRYAKSMYYYGRVIQMYGDDVRAMQIYLAALPVLEDIKEYRILGMLWENMAILNRNHLSYLEAIHCSREAIDYYYQSQDTLGVAYAYQTMGHTFFLLQEIDSVSVCIDKSLSVLRINPNKLTISANKLLGLIYGFQKKYKQAETLLLKVLHDELDESRKVKHCMALGHLYHKTGNKQNSEKYLKTCLKSSDLMTRAEAYYCLAELSLEESDLKQATIFRQKSDSLFALSENDKKRDEIMQLQARHLKEKFREESLQMKWEKEMIFIVGFIIIIALLIFMYHRYKKYCITKQQRDLSQKRLEKEVDEKKMSQEEAVKLQMELFNMKLQYEEMIHDLDEKISALEVDITIKFSEKESQIAQYREKIKSLEQNLSIVNIQSTLEMDAVVKKLDNPNENVDKILCQIDPIIVVRLLKENKIVDEYMSKENWTRIFGFVNELYGDILTYLKTTYPHLSDTNMKLISLLLLRFSAEEIRFVFDYKDVGVLSRTKLRLKKIFDLKKEDKLELFLDQCQKK